MPRDYTTSKTITDEMLPFVWRVTSHPEGRIQIEAGDQFAFSDMFIARTEGAEQCVIEQVGAEMLLKACKIFGMDNSEASAFLYMAMGGGLDA